VPVVQMVSVGAPPAVRVGPGEHYPELEPVITNLDKVLSDGLDLYRAMDDSMVFFNPLFITSEELTYLDQAGKLKEVVPDYGEVTGNQPQAIPDSEISRYVDRGQDMAATLGGMGQQGAAEAASAPAAPSVVPTPSRGQQSDVAGRQAQAMQAYGGPPTSGPRPGGGRLLNALLQPPPA